MRCRNEEEESSDSEDSNAEGYYDRLCNAYGFNSDDSPLDYNDSDYLYPDKDILYDDDVDFEKEW